MGRPLAHDLQLVGGMDRSARSPSRARLTTGLVLTAALGTTLGAAPQAQARPGEPIAPSRAAMRKELGPVSRLVARGVLVSDMFRIGLAQRARGTRGSFSDAMGPEGSGQPGMRAMLRGTMKLALDGKMWAAATQLERTPLGPSDGHAQAGYTLRLSNGGKPVGSVTVATTARDTQSDVDWYSENRVDVDNRRAATTVSYTALNRGGHAGAVEARVRLAKEGDPVVLRYEEFVHLNLSQILMSGKSTVGRGSVTIGHKPTISYDRAN